MPCKCRPAFVAPSLVLLFAVASASQAFSQQGIITTFAGGGPNSSTALSADVFPQGVAVDASGNIFIAGMGMHQVFEVSAAGAFTVVAGTGTAGFSGDGGPATNASLDYPFDVAVDSHGNLFIGDEGNQRIRRVDAVTGVITTAAGTGQMGFSGDGGPATSANLNGPCCVTADAQGNLFIADDYNQRIRRVDAASGAITTVAGNGQSGYSGDGGPATSAALSFPTGVAIDPQSNLFIADLYNQRIRRVDATTGIITTYAGNGGGASLGDGGPAINARLSGPIALAVDAHGNLFIADSGDGRIRRVDAITQIMTTAAGTVPLGAPDGDGGAATNASINDPEGLAVDPQGDLFIGDVGSGRVRRVDGVGGIITTVAGSGSGGDGGAATSGLLDYPAGIAIDDSDNVFIVDQFSQRVRRVDGVTGIITTLAGNGVLGYSGDGGSATAARLWEPYGAALDAQSDVFIADSANNRIRRVDAVSGTITTVAGNGHGGFSGDGGPATNASLAGPYSVALDAQGNYFIGDSGNNRVRRVDGATGIVTTVAGDGMQGFGGDGGPATSASLNLGIFGGVALDAKGNLFIADAQNNRIRRVDALTGIITTVVGTGEPRSTGDGGPAVNASVPFPLGVAVDAQGNLFVAETRIRRVDVISGIITTVAGNGNLNFGGDGGPATSASVHFATGVAVSTNGTLFISDSPYNRIRVVPLPPFVALSAATLTFASQPKGTTSAAQTITLTNTGLVPLAISGAVVAGTNVGDYGETDSCGRSLGPWANCAINVTFTPSAAGPSTATLTITDNAPGSPQSVSLSGTGQGPDFTLAVSETGNTATVTAGQTATYNLSVTPLAGLAGTVGFTCTGAPAQAGCTVNPASLNLIGSASVPVTVTVSTAARSAVGIMSKPPVEPWIWVWWLGALSVLSLISIRKRRLGWRRARALPGLATLVLLLCSGCGGSEGVPQGAGTPAGTYTLTVTASIVSGTTTLQHTVALTLTVSG